MKKIFSDKDNKKIKVTRININNFKEWLTKKHYAQRMCSVSHAFGLFIDGQINGVCTFGIPASRFQFSKQPYELNRLVVNENLAKNTLSKFLGMVLKKFHKPAIIVSYADENYGHHGYIYQATNWIYTLRSSSEKKIFINGKELHRRTIYEKYGTSSISKLKKIGFVITFEEQLGKHRYFQFTGTKRDIKKLKNEVILKYGTHPYPKGNNTRYNSSYITSNQMTIL